MKVDVRDTEYIWCHGLIKLKITYPDAPAVLLVHYDVKTLEYKFEIDFRDGAEYMMNSFLKILQELLLLDSFHLEQVWFYF